jgi:hypothetical protein
MHGEPKANGVSNMGRPVVQSCAKPLHPAVSVPCAKLWA